MSPPIRKAFDNLERQKEAVLSGVSAWSMDRLRFRPAPGMWSALNVLDHLVKVEKGVMASVKTNLPDGHSITFRDRFGVLMVMCVMRSPMRVKVPASATAVLPGEATDLPALAKQWRDIREEMPQTLAGLPPGRFCRGVFQHPVGGWMSILQTMGFLSSHLTHHEYQLKRLGQAATASEIAGVIGGAQSR